MKNYNRCFYLMDNYNPLSMFHNLSLKINFIVIKLSHSQKINSQAFEIIYIHIIFVLDDYMIYLSYCLKIFSFNCSFFSFSSLFKKILLFQSFSQTKSCSRFGYPYSKSQLNEHQDFKKQTLDVQINLFNFLILKESNSNASPIQKKNLLGA